MGIRLRFSGSFIHFNEFQNCGTGVHIFGEDISSTLVNKLVQIGDDYSLSGCDQHYRAFSDCNPIISAAPNGGNPNKDITNLFVNCNNGILSSRRTTLTVIRNGFSGCTNGTRIQNVRSLLPNNSRTTYSLNRNYNTRYGLNVSEAPIMRFIVNDNQFCISPSYFILTETRAINIS